ncbi:MAG: 4-hydroxy-3-methylbut-2-enyl diphosphate reductase [Rubrivivax sp.]|jgi:4-hydroxy-3-methylbut-2-enyl diphosphate reductase|nr:4-hydroxy-3-methylbut-2-enyl diphosphate reductase [Rubrivivax sp.]
MLHPLRAVPEPSPGAAVPAQTVVLASPRGFCAGVVRAIDIVETALALHGAPIYVFHEIVHNGHVVADLRARGAVFVDRIADVPEGAPTVFSAHGVSRAVIEEARARGLQVVDATCPLVAKVHQQVQRYARQGMTIVVIGHAGHEEVEGTLGSADAPMHLVGTVRDVAELDLPADVPLAYVTQTTLSVDDTRDIIAAIEHRWPQVVGPSIDDICYATQNRQQAVRQLAQEVDFVVVVGAPNSSNTRRLLEVARQQGARARLVTCAEDVDASWLAGVRAVGVTAGASTPERLVRDVVKRLHDLGAGRVRELPGVREHVVFRLPPMPWPRPVTEAATEAPA